MAEYGIAGDQWFWGNVHKTDACWLWTGERNRNGYGIARYRELSGLAHRVSYQIHTGEIPAGMVVCHSCDVRHCVAPHHLWIGTHQENMDDMVAKGRSLRREVADPGLEIVQPPSTPQSIELLREALEMHGTLTVGQLERVLVEAGFTSRTAIRRVAAARKRRAIVVDRKEGLRIFLRLPQPRPVL